MTDTGEHAKPESAAIRAVLEAHGFEVHMFWGDDPSLLARMNQILQQAHRPTAIVAVIDTTFPTAVPAASASGVPVVVFRTSAYRSSLRAHERILPYVWEGKTRMPAVPAAALPRVAFCGLLSHPLRAQAVQRLRAAHGTGVYAQFHVKEGFWGGKPHDPAVVKDFDENMARAEFNLCLRGNGNWSMRLYQTLSAGRIPVIVDSDMVLPFEDRIDWSAICVRSRSVDTLVEDIRAFWSRHDVVAVQYRCHQTYAEFFHPARAPQRLVESIGLQGFG